MIESVESATSAVINELCNNGHEVYLINSQDSREKQQTFLHPRFHHCPLSLTYSKEKTMKKILSSLLFQIFCLIKLYSLTRKIHFDMIYYNDTFAALSWKFAKKIIHVPAIMYLGDIFSGNFQFHRLSIIRILERLIISVELKFYRSLDKILVVSKTFEEFLINNGFPHGKVSVVYDHVDVHKFSPMISSDEVRRNYNLNGFFVVISHGLLAPFKNMECLVKAIPLVLNEIQNVKFMIIGDGPSIMSLRKLAESKKISRSLIFTKWIKYDDIPKYLAVADVGVVPRRRGLTNELVISQTLLQYMASGKPIAAASLRGFKEVIKLGAGILFEPENEGELAKAIVYLLRNHEKSAEMGRTGRLLCEQRFNKDIISKVFVSHIVNYENLKYD